jgi:hypothetical protein
MATTTNYGFEIPDDTDLVKDGALAMRDLGQDVDTTLATALNANDYAGLVLVKKQTIGSAVSSVQVTGAFSATYDNYLICVSGGAASGSQTIALRLGATATGYYAGGFYNTYVAGSTDDLAVNNGASWTFAGFAAANGNSAEIFLNSPNLAKQTTYRSTFSDVGTGGGLYMAGGMVTGTTQYTDFTLIVAGSMTGGTVYVYGYGAS